MRLGLILGLVLVASASAQRRRPAAPPKPPAATPATTPASNRWPIQSIAIEGNHLYTARQVIAVTGLRIGQLAAKSDFEAARDRLIATGAFETVGYRFAPTADAQGYAASFQITEALPAYPVRFSELGVPDNQAASALRARDPLFGEKIPATKPVLERYAAVLQELVAGKVSERIIGRVTAVAPDDFVVLFRPARNLPAVAQVSFAGNQAISAYILRDAIGAVAIGQPYTDAAFRGLLDTSVRPLYEARGRIRVAFPQVRSEPATDVQGVNVFVTISEGESFDLGEVEIAGPTPVKPADLLKTANLKPGDLANFDAVNQGLERIRTAVRHAGYMQAKATAERKIDDAKKKVALVIHIDAGPRFTMGTLTVKGLDLTAEAEIRRMWALKPGAPFNSGYPDHFLQRIREDQIFEGLGKTTADVKVDDGAKTADVTLNFGAAPPEPVKKRRQPDDQLPPGEGPPI